MYRNDGIKRLDSEKAGASIQTVSYKICSPLHAQILNKG